MNNNLPAIDVKNLNKAFDKKNVVIDFSLKLPKGEICGFLGPNGSGKTTCLRMLCGLLKPDSGHGQCLGFDLLRNPYDIKKQVGYMPQKFSLYDNLTVIENLEFTARLYGIKQKTDKILDVLQLFNLNEYKNQLTKKLSGGWKQRLGLASCLLHDPKLLLLDEPTGGMDSKARRDFWDDLFVLSERGITSLVSTHYMDEAERCSYLVYILSGRLLVEGTISEIQAKANITTWMVKGSYLIDLERKLQKLPGIDLVAFFGDQLHVSGTNEEMLMQSIAPYKQYEWKKISPSLEDSFMSLAGKG
jgi:ABC-2 type transport system ATP-binding protein